MKGCDNMKKRKIRFDSDAFDKYRSSADQKSIMSYPYTKKIAEMEKDVESLDRFDDFSSLKIHVSNYKKKEGDVYGIERTSFHPTNEVIFKHQKDAATLFLRDLRGFGLLADVVGSGKTYEAGLVLSELSARNKLQSLLLVVPENVIDYWKEVLEMKFGMGKGVIKLAKDFYVDTGSSEKIILDIERVTRNNDEDNIRKPICPLIVSLEDFSKWGDESSNLLFDAIVVDEAHHLCMEEGEYAHAMRLLSLMMVTKKKAGSTYCILLSATPHSGDLDHMFRLWYFIRCKGGNPNDFEIKDDSQRTAEYRKEKEYYHKHICKNASTVIEFIEVVKNIVVVGEENGLDSGSRNEKRIRSDFDKYLKENGILDFKNRHSYEKKKLVNSFLNSNNETKSIIIEEIANAYHNKILRPIMIRQPKRKDNNTIGKTKEMKNYLFFPTKNKIEKFTIAGLERGSKIEVDPKNLYGDKAIKNLATNEYYSLVDYVHEFRGTSETHHKYAEFLLKNIIKTIDDFDVHGKDNEIFKKKGSYNYYMEQLRSSPKESTLNTQIIPVEYNPEGTFEYKMKVLKEILTRHSREHILIFFDYEGKNNKKIIDKVNELLRQEPKFKNRIFTSKQTDKQLLVKEFEEKEAAILIVEDASFTESMNLQKSNIAINFQVTSDPLSMDQRIGRIFRIGQREDVIIYSLADMNQLEGYVLMYYARIGLLTSVSGDATLIAGSSENKKVALRCGACNKVALFDMDDYKYLKDKLSKGEKEGDILFCTNDPDRCTIYNKRGTEMEQIGMYDFKCSTCNNTFTRTADADGYTCMGTDRKVMCNSGRQGDRTYYCRKICSVLHCTQFMNEYSHNCEIMKRYENPLSKPDEDLMKVCVKCREYDNCERRGCIIRHTQDALKSCIDCYFFKKDLHSCRPKPHYLTFNEKWEAECPHCKENNMRGVVRPVVAKTFATYIKNAWDFSYDQSLFVNDLLNESKNVGLIREVLETDKMGNE